MPTPRQKATRIPSSMRISRVGKPSRSEIAAVRWFPEFQQPLGLFILSVAYVEKHLTMLLWLLHNSPKATEIFATLGHIRSFDARVDLFSQLCHWRFKRNKRILIRAVKLAKAMENTNARRNELIHAQWQGNGKAPFVFRRLLQNKQIVEREVNVSPNVVKRDALKAFRVGRELIAFHGAVTRQNEIDLQRASRSKS